jgi:CheY-like chemotaxis protein
VTLDLEAVTMQPQIQTLGAARRVLLIDDIDASRNSLEAKLRMFQFDCIAVASVDEAWDLLDRNTPFDVVLADELMPGRGALELLAALRADARFAKLPLVMLSLFGADPDTADRPLQPDDVVLKPPRGTALAETLDRVLSGNGQRLAPVRPAPAVNTTFRGARVLLVEDNPVNQRVAQRILHKLAVTVTTAGNGAEALDRLADAAFDVVLMDCQMPVMDGFTATRRLREAERRDGNATHLPVIALTANVMSEDRDNCIAAGMDAHLGKPIEPGQLIECLGRYLKTDSAPPAVDLRALRELTGGDRDFERELVDTFISSGDQNLAAIIAALQTRDYETIGRRAHALKGASVNIHAQGLSIAASHLEQAAKIPGTADFGALVKQLAERLHDVNEQLRNAG